MYKNKFIIYSSHSFDLVSEDGETIKHYDGAAYGLYAQYVGDGVFEIEYRPSIYNEYVRFVDAETGGFIGGKYETHSTTDFKEGYATVEDLDGKKYVIDKDGNKYYAEYAPTKQVSDGMLNVFSSDKSLPGIIRVPKYKPTRLLINNNSVNLCSKPQKINSRIFYPFRECLENLGATVSWDSLHRKAIGEYNGVTVEFLIDDNRYYVNGKEHKMDTAAYVDYSNEKTYIPIRYAAEAFGFNVDWTETDSECIVSVHG